MQLNIPVHQTITLPDAWQACKTPQELSYWLIAKLDGIQTDIDSVSEAIKEFPALQSQMSALNESFTTLSNTVNTMNSDIGGLRADVQQNAENISGAEDRIATNTGSIIDLKRDLTWYIKHVSVYVRVGGNPLRALFDYYASTDRVPSSFSDMISDMHTNPTLPTDLVQASGTYVVQGAGQGVIIGYVFESDSIKVYYSVAGTPMFETLNADMTFESFSITVQPV